MSDERTAITALLIVGAPSLAEGVTGWQQQEPGSRAELGPLITDRPDFTESTDAVPRGHVQLEMGYTYTYDREHRARDTDHTAPEILLRVGFADNWELRIGWAGYSWSESVFEEFRGTPPRTVTREDWSHGSNDLILGFKYKFAEQEGWRPHLGVIGEITIPSGTIGVSSGDVDPAVKLLWAYDLSDTTSVAGNLNLAVPTEDGHRFVQASASLSLAVALSDTVGTYIEYFGFYPSSDGQDAAHVLNGGFTFQTSENFQWDIRAGFGLNSQADDFVAGVGFSLRL